MTGRGAGGQLSLVLSGHGLVRCVGLVWPSCLGSESQEFVINWPWRFRNGVGSVAWNEDKIEVEKEVKIKQRVLLRGALQPSASMQGRGSRNSMAQTFVLVEDKVG